jgi:hypothetical protein
MIKVKKLKQIIGFNFRSLCQTLLDSLVIFLDAAVSVDGLAKLLDLLLEGPILYL